MGALEKAIDSAMQNNPDEFPIDVFPESIQRLILNAKDTVQYDPGYLSAGILSTIATSIGKRSSLNNGSYSVLPILWIVIVGRRGTGKTHPLKFAKQPLEEIDNENYAEYEKELSEYEKSNGVETTGKPTFKKYLLDDFTLEKLIEILQFNRHGVLIFQDELMKWVNNFNRYKSGGEQQSYLTLWNGDTLNVDRKTIRSYRVNDPCVNILGGMQTERLKSFAANRIDDGFLDRFLFVIPENYKPRLFKEETLDLKLVDNYKRLINNIIDFEGQKINTTSKTIEIYKKWQHKRVYETNKDDIEAAVFAKLDTYVWRLALVLEMAFQASKANFTPKLSSETMEKAIELADYFYYQALKIHDKLATKDPIEQLNEDQREFYEKLPKKFKRKEGVEIGMSLGFTRISADRFLRNHPNLFKQRKEDNKLAYGEYLKKYD